MHFAARSFAWTLIVGITLQAAHAQSYPARMLRAIVPAGTGTPTDLLARAVAQNIAPLLGQPMVIENRVGANGLIGMEGCAKSAPDGYNLCFIANAQVSLNPFIYANLPYDPVKDFAPVVHTGVINAALVVTASMPVNSLRELIDLAKAKPGALNWASWGIGSPSHLYLAWVQHRTGTVFMHVPYKEPSQAFTAVASGEANVIVNATGATAAMVRAGKMKAFAVTGSKRSAFLPDVPTFSELGIDIDYRGWNGLLAPVAVPRDIVLRLNADVNRLLQDQAFTSKSIIPLGVEPVGGTPEEFAAFIRADMKIGAELVKLAGLKPQ
jgi:tripartite-type tricarboxylate transporter receptor subunit TctC